ncbi:hypothetical protein [Thalassotalea marina]|uniref:Uncharacterized protein n=1 Tax=Thalassotalea marina TaxID=1673741 RepID=A0A919BF55_9GAMM|nr:hypothetical protein [Thalassotalea marina]GHF83974.1 hypothetical protein GCM10017161_09170 [Thalassotalea marina]
MRSFAKQLLLIGSVGISFTVSSVTEAAELKDSPEIFAGMSSSHIVFNNQHQYSLLTLASAETVPDKTCKVVKRNELYELSAILSDKIHVFLAYFDKKPKFQIVEKEEDKNALSMNRPNIK